MTEKHQAIFEEFTKTFPQATLEKWKADVERWEADPYNAPLDPFIERDTCEWPQYSTDKRKTLIFITSRNTRRCQTRAR